MLTRVCALVLCLVALAYAPADLWAYSNDCLAEASPTASLEKQSAPCSQDLNHNIRVTLGGSAGGGFGLSTAAAPTLIEGAGASFSFDLTGNARVTFGTLLSGEDQANNLLMTSGGANRITSLGAVTSATSSTPMAIFTGPVRFMGQITNATSETKALTVDIYGNWTSSTTGGDPICRIILPSTATVTHLEDTCPTVTPDYLYYYYTVTVYTSASAAPFTLYAMQ